MIDIQNKVYTVCAEALRAAHPGIDVSARYIEKPAKFPHISIVEYDNAAYEQSQTLGVYENHAQLMYQVDIHSNDATYAQSICRDIAKTVDEKFAEMGFTRRSMFPTPNIDRTIYRLTLRYSAVISQPIVADNGNKTYLSYTR